MLRVRRPVPDAKKNPAVATSLASAGRQSLAVVRKSYSCAMSRIAGRWDGAEAGMRPRGKGRPFSFTVTCNTLNLTLLPNLSKASYLNYPLVVLIVAVSAGKCPYLCCFFCLVPHQNLD